MTFADLIPGLVEGASEALAKRQAQRNRLAEILYKEQAKQTLDPEAQAKGLALRMILGQPTPTPMGGYNPTERQAGLPQAVERQAGQGQLTLLQQFGLLPKAPLSLHDIFAQSQARSAGSGAQAEKSYEVHNKSLDQYQKPVDERLDRLSRLQDTMNQMTPQADALLAPELLTVMAGGQGSGLRMNEAEIARIVGGRTNLEGMKAALNKWQVDPTKGLSVTPAQRAQMRSLVSTVHEKLLKKSEILNTARQQLIDATAPMVHRQVLFEARQALQEVDGMGEKAPEVTATKDRLRAKYGR